MRWVRRLFIIVCLVLTGMVVWAGIYARKNGFTDSWRNAIEREFEKRGYHVEIGKITLGAFRGLVAEDVRFYLDIQKQDEVAFIDDVYLDVDLSKILRKQISVNTLDVDDASLSLPLDPSKPSGRKLQVDKLSGRIVITESVIEIVSAEASIANINLELSGSLIRPQLDGNDSDELENEAADTVAVRRAHVLRIVEELEKYEFLDAPPLISAEFRGDLDDFTTMTANARIESGRFRQKGQSYEIEGLDCSLNFDGVSQEAKIDKLSIRDGKGEILVGGHWTAESNLFNFELESNADVSSLLGLFWNDSKLREVVFFTPPEIKLNGELDLSQFGEEGLRFPGSVIGELNADRFVTRGTVFSGLNFGFSAEGERAYVRNLRLDHNSGVAFANIKYEPDSGDQSIRYHTEIKLNPHVFRPFFHESGRKLIDTWDFDDSSTVYIAIVGQGRDWEPEHWDNKGVLDLRNFKLNGIPFTEMEAEFESEEEVLRFQNIAMVRGEGEIKAESAHYLVPEKQWEVKGVVSTVDLLEGARAFSPKLASNLTQYDFDSPPTIQLAGLLDARRNEEVGSEVRRNKISLSFQGKGALYYEFCGKRLRLSDPVGKVNVDGSRVHLSEFNCGVLGGRVSVEYDGKDVKSPSKPYDASVRVIGVPLEAVTKHYGDVEVATGEIDATIHLSGFGKDISRLNGHGAASIENGELFALPVLGALAGATQVSAGSGGIVKEGQCTFTINNGVLKTSDFVALADGMYVRCAGDVSLIDYSVDLDAVVNTRGTVSRAILTPVSELLTFSCSGTVQDPVWKAKHISNLGKIPAQVITEMSSVPIEGLKMLGQGIFGNMEGRHSSATGGNAGRVQKPGEGLRNLGQGIFGNQSEGTGPSNRGSSGQEKKGDGPKLFPRMKNKENSRPGG